MDFLKSGPPPDLLREQAKDSPKDNEKDKKKFLEVLYDPPARKKKRHKQVKTSDALDRCASQRLHPPSSPFSLPWILCQIACGSALWVDGVFLGAFVLSWPCSLSPSSRSPLFSLQFIFPVLLPPRLVWVHLRQMPSQNCPVGILRDFHRDRLLIAPFPRYLMLILILAIPRSTISGDDSESDGDGDGVSFMDFLRSGGPPVRSIRP